LPDCELLVGVNHKGVDVTDLARRN